MAKICPFTKDVVLYLDCKECDDTEECRRISIMGEDHIEKSEKEECDIYEK